MDIHPEQAPINNINTLIPSEFKRDVSKIIERMPSIISGIEQHGKRNSHTSTSLMSLNMIDSGPYRVLRQILAQIDKKMAALKENSYRIAKSEIKLNQLREKEDRNSVDALKILKLQDDIESSKPYIHGCIREIGALQDRYFEVMRNNNIPENWTEKDFEAAEIEHHIKSIFRNALRDRMANCYNYGTMEYMEQYGIEPVLAYKLTDSFLEDLKNKANLAPPSIEMRYAFYDKMYSLFKNEYKKAMKRIGLNSVVYADWLLKTET